MNIVFYYYSLISGHVARALGVGEVRTYTRHLTKPKMRANALSSSPKRSLGDTNQSKRKMMTKLGMLRMMKWNLIMIDVNFIFVLFSHFCY